MTGDLPLHHPPRVAWCPVLTFAFPLTEPSVGDFHSLFSVTESPHMLGTALGTGEVCLNLS